MAMSTVQQRLHEIRCGSSWQTGTGASSHFALEAAALRGPTRAVDGGTAPTELGKADYESEDERDSASLSQRQSGAAASSSCASPWAVA